MIDYTSLSAQYIMRCAIKNFGIPFQKEGNLNKDNSPVKDGNPVQCFSKLWWNLGKVTVASDTETLKENILFLHIRSLLRSVYKHIIIIHMYKCMYNIFKQENCYKHGSHSVNCLGVLWRTVVGELRLRDFNLSYTKYMLNRLLPLVQHFQILRTSGCCDIKCSSFDSNFWLHNNLMM